MREARFSQENTAQARDVTAATDMKLRSWQRRGRGQPGACCAEGPEARSAYRRRLRYPKILDMEREPLLALPPLAPEGAGKVDAAVGRALEFGAAGALAEGDATDRGADSGPALGIRGEEEVLAIAGRLRPLG